MIQTQALRLHLLRKIGTARTPELIRKGEILLYEYSVIMISSSIGTRSRTAPMILAKIEVGATPNPTIETVKKNRGRAWRVA